MTTLRMVGSLLIGLGSLSLPGSVQAGTIFRDTFSDGDIEDGIPVSWQQVSPFSGGVDATSGDLVLSPTQTTAAQAVIVAVDNLGLNDVSIRAQGRILDPPDTGGGLELLGRANVTTRTAYGGGVDSNGLVYIYKGGTGGVNIVEAQTDLRPLDEDVVLQFDVFGSTLSMWAWRPGSPMPIAPLVSADDDRITVGEDIGIDYFANSLSENLGSGVFRYVHVADMHIPEPASFALVAIGVLGLAVFGLRRCEDSAGR